MRDRKRTELTVQQKLDIVAACNGPPKQTYATVARKLNIDPSTVSKLYRNQTDLSDVLNLNKYRKRKRHSRAEDVDRALHKWFVGALATNINISGEILRVKAETFARDLSVENFVPTNGWLDRWKKRYGIIYKKSHGEKLDADVPAANEWISTTLVDIFRRYEPKDIFNADETGLLWRAMPSGSHVFKSIQLSGGKILKDRITILLCASMVGEKEPVLVIGRSKTPRCFRGVKVLPVNYKSNNNAWMTSSIFEEWLRQWDKTLASQRRKIALVLDNCSAHPKLTLFNIELVFLPPNVTSLVQPCDQGIIRNFKFHYRRLLVLKLLAVIESSSDHVLATKMVKQLDLLNSVLLIKEAWTKVTSLTIQNCYKKSKFCNDSSSIIEGDELVANLNELDFNFSEYVEIDSNTECSEPLNDKMIVDSIVKQKQRDEINALLSDDSDDETEPNSSTITKSVALESLRNIQIFLMNNNCAAWDCFTEMDHIIQRTILQSSSKTQQLTLEKWFK